MDYVRVTAHADGKLLIDLLYKGTTQYKALERFRAECPGLSEYCIVIAEDYDPGEHMAHFLECLKYERVYY